jgi:hypothetical protein
MSEPAETQVDDASVTDAMAEYEAGEWSQRRYEAETERITAWAAVLAQLPEFEHDLRGVIVEALTRMASSDTQEEC